MREILRRETDMQHLALDTELGALDPAKVEDLGALLCVHARALPPLEAALRDWDGDGAGNPFAAGRLSGLVRQDLAALGLAAPAPLPMPAVPAGGRIGVAYVLAGSRLGARVLARRWRESDDAAVRRAGRYLGDREGQGYWQALLHVLATAEIDVPAATAGAVTAFDLFSRALSESRRMAA